MRRNQGIALVVALAVMAIIFLLVAGAFVTTQIQMWTSRNDAVSTQAHYVADAGLQGYKSTLFQYYRWLEQQQQRSGSCMIGGLNDGIYWNWDSASPTLMTWSNNQMDMGNENLVIDGKTVGWYHVTLTRDPTNPFITVTSVGHANRGTATVQGTFWVMNSGVLDQAIFAQAGQSNRYLNGNVTVRGGIYVVGNEAAQSDTVLNADGNFSQYNSYDLTNYTNQSGQPLSGFTSQPKSDNLCATLRVQYGQVQVGGSSSFGTPSNKLLGVFVDHGASDVLSQGNFLNTCSQTKGMCTQQGPSAFDISADQAPKFPTFQSDGGCDSAGTEWGTCITGQASTQGDGILLSMNSDGTPSAILYDASGNAVGDPVGQTDCLDKLTTPLVLGSQSITCTYTTTDGRTAGFSYDGSSSPASFKVYGTVDLKGFDVQFTEPVRYTADTYSSDGSYATHATFVVSDSGGNAGGGTGGNITTEADVLPNTDATSGGGDYPGHVLAFIAQNSFTQGTTTGTGNPTTVMAPVYAGDHYYSEKGNLLVGQAITQFYCTTSSGTCPQTGQGAGANSEVIYVNTNPNKPKILTQVEKAGTPLFKALSYQNR